MVSESLKYSSWGIISVVSAAMSWYKMSFHSTISSGNTAMSECKTAAFCGNIPARNTARSYYFNGCFCGNIPARNMAISQYRTAAFVAISRQETQQCLSKKTTIFVALSLMEIKWCHFKKTTAFSGIIPSGNTTMSHFLCYYPSWRHSNVSEQNNHCLWHFPLQETQQYLGKRQHTFVALCRQQTHLCLSKKTAFCGPIPGGNTAMSQDKTTVVWGNILARDTAMSW